MELVPRDSTAGARRDKAPGAFRTIGELSQEIGVPQHVLRYWEGRFVQLRPVQRAGGRRYYRPEDVALVRRIHDMLGREGFTVRGAQRVLAGEEAPPAAASAADHADPRLAVIRARLAEALAADLA